MVLFGAVFLLCGIVIGVGGGRYFDRMNRDRFMNHPERMPELITERLTSELKLSPEQAKEVREILAERLKNLRKIQEESRPRLDKELDELRDEVAQKLDEAQSKKWRENFIRMRHFLPPPPFMPPPRK